MIPSPKIVAEVLWEFYGEDIKRFIGNVIKVGVLAVLFTILAIIV